MYQNVRQETTPRAIGRYILAAPDSAFLDPQQPWITLPEGDQIFETQPAT
jgi:hypothetical protein